MAQANMGAGTSSTDTWNPVAYVPKPTHNPNAATNRNNVKGNDSSDTHMHDATAEEEKKNKIDKIYTQNKSLFSKISLLSIAADVLDDVTRRFCVVEGPHGGKKVQQQQQKRKYNKIEGRKRGEGGVFFFIIIIIFNATQESATAGILLFVVCVCVWASGDGSEKPVKCLSFFRSFFLSLSTKRDAQGIENQ